jgi:starch synthase
MPAAGPLDVVLFAAEAAPFVKVGGLAEVVGKLPRYLEGLGVRCAVVIPGYRAIVRERFGMVPFAPLPEFPVPMGAGTARAVIDHGRLPGTSADVLVVGSAEYFDRDGVYDDPSTREGFSDNMQRFVFFAKAGLAAARALGRRFDVVHCHDSQAGLVPGLLATAPAPDPLLGQAGRLFTIHNLAYQGIYGPETLAWAGIDGSHFHAGSPFEFWGKVNFMKVGIECSDLLSTVSETYAREIQTSSEYGHGLEGVLRRRRDHLFGIVNGIDGLEWNPETDPLLPARFSSRDLGGKAVCKRELLAAFGLPRPPGRVLLVGIVSRLADQKGFDLIGEAAGELARLDLQLVVLGDGQSRHRAMLQELAARHPERIAVRFGYDDRLAHLVEAGSDAFLMPSRYEPCGLNQLYSLRYGTVPIVRATGGLADTVESYDLETGTGSGFRFEAYAATEMLLAVRKALAVYGDGARWGALVARIMDLDWSWERSARTYAELYRRLRDLHRDPAPPASGVGNPT